MVLLLQTSSRLRIVLIHLHLKIPTEGGALRSYLIASGLLKRGWDVEVITAHHAAYYEFLEVDGLKIHRLPVKYSNSYGFFRRIRSYLSFNKKAFAFLESLERPDFLYCISTPLTIGRIGLKAKKKLGLPYIFEVGDLWPEAPIQMGAIKNPWLKSRLFRLEKTIYEEASHVISLSPGIESGIRKRCANADIIYLPNMSDRNFFDFKSKQERNNELMPGFPFLIGCIGAIGKANHLDYLVHAARHFNTEQIPVGFLIMGDGSERERLIRMSEDLPNLKFLPFSKRNLVKEVLESMDAVYISFKNIPILQTGSPNKFFDALAAGKPVITNFGGWIKEQIEDAGCGFSYEPNQPEQLAEKLSAYLDDPTLIDRQGKAALQLAETYDMEILLDEFSKRLTHSFNENAR